MTPTAESKMRNKLTSVLWAFRTTAFPDGRLEPYINECMSVYEAALHNAGKRGREEAIEECYKVAESCSGKVSVLATNSFNKDLVGYTAKTIAEAIRSLK